MKTRSRRVVVTALTALVAAALLPAAATAQAQLFELDHSDASEWEYFGYSCDISGDRAIVGSVWDLHAGLNSGSAFIYDVSTGQQLFKLLPTPAQDWMSFAYNVAIDGDRAVVGAPDYGAAGTRKGAAFLYDVGTGQQLQMIVPADNEMRDYFGIDVAMNEAYIVVGAPGDKPNGSWSGSAYVFDRSTGRSSVFGSATMAQESPTCSIPCHWASPSALETSSSTPRAPARTTTTAAFPARGAPTGPSPPVRS